MDIDAHGFDRVHLLGGSATHSPVPRLPRHAALLVFAGMSLPRPRALPGTPITALASASNCGFQDHPRRLRFKPVSSSSVSVSMTSVAGFSVGTAARVAGAMRGANLAVMVRVLLVMPAIVQSVNAPV